MFCPVCRSEYREGVTRCPDCGVALVDRLPPEEKEEKKKSRREPVPRKYRQSRWVMIYSPSGAQEVALVKMIMERENIPCFVGNELTRRAALYAPVNLAFELWVPEETAERAWEILKKELELDE